MGSLFLSEVIREVLLAALVMGVTLLGAGVGHVLAPPPGELVGAVLGLLVGVAIAVVLRRPAHRRPFRSAARG